MIKYMSQLIIRHDDDTREIRYDVKEWEEPTDVLYTIVHLMPVELDRIMKGTPEEVQKILKLHI